MFSVLVGYFVPLSTMNMFLASAIVIYDIKKTENPKFQNVASPDWEKI